MYKAEMSRNYLSCILLMGIAMQAVAGEDVHDGSLHPWKEMTSTAAYTDVFMLSVGPVWQSSGGNETTFYLQPGVQKTFDPNPSNSALADGEFFWGLQRTLTSHFAGQLGVAVAATSSAHFTGRVWDDADPDFSNFIYHYRVNHAHVAIKGKLLANVNERRLWLASVQPWISGSVGAGLNNATHFTLTQLLPEAFPFPPFHNHNATAYTYTIGIGVQRAIVNQVQVGVGYEFADWGKSQLAPATGQTLGSGLWSNHLYTNGLMFNITYLA